jgi:heavy metal efflux system protein
VFKKIKMKKIIALFLAIINSLSINAQEYITLTQATDLAIKNNLGLQNERLKTGYAKALIESYKNIPNANILTDLGQFNSAFFDTKLGISQTLKFSKIHTTQKTLLTQELTANQINQTIKEADLKRIIQQIFSNYLILDKKLKLLQQNDSTIQSLLNKASIRLSNGETNSLEKSTFEIYRNNGQIQMQYIQNEMDGYIAYMKVLNNTDTPYIPIGNYRMAKISNIENLELEAHPQVAFLKQYISIAKTNTNVEQNKLLPDLLVAYNNGSIRGVGANEKFYSSGNRFHSVQIGLGIPIVKKFQKASINASKINETIAENNLKIEKEALKYKIANSYKQQENYQKIADNYQQLIQTNIKNIAEVALKQLVKGEMNYHDYAQIINQNLDVQLGYYDAVKLLNDSTIELNYFLNK